MKEGKEDKERVKSRGGLLQRKLARHDGRKGRELLFFYFIVLPSMKDYSNMGCRRSVRCPVFWLASGISILLLLLSS
jgi:hypothetical protein